METLLGVVDPDDLMGIGLAAIAVIGGLLIALVGLFTQHQRKMAELFRRESVPAGQTAQMDRLESEVKELKDRMNHLILAVEDRSTVWQSLSPPDVPEHLGL